MPIISLICKQCGGQISLDDSKEFGFCNHCGTKIILKDDITHNTYQTTHNTTHHTTQLITKIVQGNVYGAEADQTIEELIAEGEKLLKLKRIEKANKVFEKATEQEPDNWHAWYGYARAGGNAEKDEDGYSYYPIDAFKNALELADDNGKVEITAYILKAAKEEEPYYFGFGFSGHLALDFLNLIIVYGGQEKIEALAQKVIITIEKCYWEDREIERFISAFDSFAVAIQENQDTEEFQKNIYESILKKLEYGIIGSWQVSNNSTAKRWKESCKKMAAKARTLKYADYRLSFCDISNFLCDESDSQITLRVLDYYFNVNEDVKKETVSFFNKLLTESNDYPVSRNLAQSILSAIDKQVAEIRRQTEAQKLAEERKQAILKLIEDYKIVLQSGNKKEEKQFLVHNTHVLLNLFSKAQGYKGVAAAQKFAKSANKGKLSWDGFSAMLLGFWY